MMLAFGILLGTISVGIIEVLLSDRFFEKMEKRIREKEEKERNKHLVWGAQYLDY